MNSAAATETKKDGSTLVSTCACKQIKLHVHLATAPQPTTRTVRNNDNKEIIDASHAVQAVDCHCPSCRKFHMAAFASYLNISPDQVDFINECQTDLSSYQETCSEMGAVERLFCRHCYTKMATKPIPAPEAINSNRDENKQDGLDNEKKEMSSSSPMENRILINMGGLVDETIPKAYQNEWKHERIIWQSSSAAVWPLARPLPRKARRGMRMPPLETTTSGSCACGQCQYQIRHVPNEMQHCYCRLCRQYCGSAYQTWIPVDNSDFAWTSSSSLVLRTTTNHGRRHFCTNCGGCMTIVYNDDPDTTWPAAGGLDDASLPTSVDDMNLYMGRACHICCIWKQAWYDLPQDGLERIKYAC